MATNAVIALTPEALNVLFPEGSQARVELQRASLDLAARHFAKNALGHEAKDFLRTLMEQMNAANIQAIKEEMRDQLGEAALTNMRGRFVLSEDVRKNLREAASVQVRAVVKEVVDEMVATLPDTLPELANLTAKRAVMKVMESELVAVTQRELADRWASIRKAADEQAGA